jgi:hypothetical protein
MQLPVLTMVCGYSRWLSAILIPTRRAEDLFAGWWELIGALGAVPRTLVWDVEGAIGRWRAGEAELTADCQAFRGVLGAKVVLLKPAEHKGIIERAHDYLERSFLPGRTFSGQGDFNHQLQQWLQMVNGRTRRLLGCAPTDRIGADRHAMLTLPPVAPATGWRSTTRLARDHYVRLDSNDYSVQATPPTSALDFAGDIKKIRAKLNEKGGKYSSLDQPLDKPLVVALQLWNHVDHDELRSALLGGTELEVPIDRATGRAMPESARTRLKFDGYWRPGADLHARVSLGCFSVILSARTAWLRHCQNSGLIRGRPYRCLG